MSRTVRIPDHLYEAVEKLASSERRSLSNMLRLLLEGALAERTEPDAVPRDGGAEPTHGRPAGHGSQAVRSSARPAVTDEHFKPDFGKKLG